MIDSTVVSLDEMQFLREKLQIGQFPVVLDGGARYDSDVTRKEMMDRAAELLAARGLLDGELVHQDLEDLVRALDRPHWVIAVRWYHGGQISRLCVARADSMDVVALLGPDAYTINRASDDLPGTVVAALGPSEPLQLEGMNVETDELSPILNDAGDSNATQRRLAAVGHPPRDAQTLASALVEVTSHASIVGVVYGDGTRETVKNTINVFNTRNGRFIATTSPSDDGVNWSSLSTGTNARLRTALKDLIQILPMREEFNPAAGIV